MEKISMIGAVVVTLALLWYTIFIVSEKKHVLNKSVLIFLSLGIVFDISATACMIIGSTNSPFTLHGFIGYTGLLLMLIDTVLIWNIYLKEGFGAAIKKSIHIYSLIAYIIWVAVYITGSLMVMMKH